MATVSMEPKLSYKPMDDLLNVPVSDIIDAHKQVPALLRITDSVDYALELLGSNKILSAPLLDIEEKLVLGFIDYVDIAGYLVDRLNTAQREHETLSAAQRKELLQCSIRNAGLIENTGNRDPFIIILAKHPATLLIQSFNSGVHRVVIYDDETRISGICSQSDVLRYVRNKISNGEGNDELDKFLLCPVDKLGWGVRPVLHVKAATSVIDCLATIRQHHISTLAIVNQKGILVGNFSASDLRGISADFMSLLHLEVIEFLGLKSKSSLKPCTVKRETSVHQVIDTLVESRLHHVWIVDEAFHAVGVITLTDVMSALYSYNPEPPLMVLPTPGFLDVSIIRARNLKSGWLGANPYVVVRFPDRPRSSFRTTVSKGKNASWEGQTFQIPIASRHYRDRVLFIVKDRHMIGRDNDLGIYLLSLDYVLDGFGTGSPMCTSVIDWFALQPKDPIETSQGEIQLKLTYKSAA